MTAVVLTGIGLWLLAKLSKAMVWLCLLVLFVLFPAKAAMVLAVLLVLMSMA